MDIKADVTIAFPREVVFTTYRERLPELTEFLPNIRSIRVAKREGDESEMRLVNEWVGGGDIPKAALAVLKESMLRWTDYATWKKPSYTVEWRTEVGAAPGVIKSSGVNTFIEVPGGTRLEIRGSLTCDAGKLPGVPRFIASSINTPVERFICAQVEVNLTSVGKAVQRLLEREAKA